MNVWRSLLLVCALVVGTASAAPASDPSALGAWMPPVAEDPLFAQRPPRTPDESKRTPPAVSMAVLPDGRVLYWGGLEGWEDLEYPIPMDFAREATSARSRVLDLSDPSSPVWSVPTPEDGGSDDMFCADQRLLAGGSVLVAGGTIPRFDPVDLTAMTGDAGPGGTAENFGSNASRLFDPATSTWTQTGRLHHARWYPSMITLADGRQLIAGGTARQVWDTSGTNVLETEIYDPATGVWTENGPSGRASLPLFARLHLLPDGTVFYAGGGHLWGPFGQAVDQALWNLHSAYDPSSDSWSFTGAPLLGARGSGLSVLLPLRPGPDGSYPSQAEILVAGGTLGGPPSTYVASRATEIVTAGDGTSSSVPGPDLNDARWYSSGVLLADGTVLAVSGTDRDHLVQAGTDRAVRRAELFDGERWTPLSFANRDRGYHNTAVLLADGSVLVGGHSPANAGFGPKGDNTYHDSGLGASNFKDPSFEIFRPPYLFRGDRPTISSVQKGIAWGSSFALDTPDAGNVEQVMLVRLGSTTHVTDADMRAVELAFDRADGDTLAVTAPPDGAIAPPGFYYLFVLRSNGDGLTPSKARVVRVGATSDPAPAIAPMGA